MNSIIDDIEKNCVPGCLRGYTVREYLKLEDSKSISYVQVSGNYGVWNSKGMFIRDSWVSPRRYDSIGDTTFIIVLEATKGLESKVQELVDMLTVKYECIEKISVY